MGDHYHFTLHYYSSALIVIFMSEMLNWIQIKERYPELAQRLRDGDMSARVEFVRLSFGAEIVSETALAPHDLARKS